MIRQDLEEGQIVLCEVQKILGTTVFCKIENNVVTVLGKSTGPPLIPDF